MNSILLLQITSARRNFVEIMHLLLNDNTTTEFERRLKDDNVNTPALQNKVNLVIIIQGTGMNRSIAKLHD